MKKTSFRDANIELEGKRLTVENSMITIEAEVGDGISLKRLINKSSDHNWLHAESIPAFNIEDGNSLSFSSVDFEEVTNYGLSGKAIRANLYFDGTLADILLKVTTYPSLPFANFEIFAKKAAKPGAPREKSDNDPYIPADTMLAMRLNPEHYSYRVVEFFDWSDKNNTLVKDHDDFCYTDWSRVETGHMFILDSYLEGEELLLVREAPSATGFVGTRRPDADFEVNANRYLYACNSGLVGELTDDYLRGYSVTVGCVSSVDEKYESSIYWYKNLYRYINLGDRSGRTYSMSNTWADRGEGENLSEEFVINEIKMAAELGVDAMQIDAMWQVGRMCDVNPRKFPNGFKPIAEACKKYGVKLGLWFEPPVNNNEYADWSLDADIFLKYFREFDARYFKVDGTTLGTKKSETNFFNFFDKISRESDGELGINYDITASKRGGYLQEKQYGTLFVENRYTDWHNYYPHFVLRNVWKMSKYLPLRRMQFEFLNNKRMQDLYTGDPLAPITYGMDYLYAITAFANPLVWLEMQNLEKADVKVLKKVIAAFKPHAGDFFNADVVPIGECPDGVSITGLDARVSDEEGYLLLFREHSKYNRLDFDVKGITSFDILYQNAPCKVVAKKNSISASFRKEASFVFLKYKR